MKITFLGTSHGITEKDRFTSSTLISVAGKNYLVDAGAPIMKLLQEQDVGFDTLGGIFITHSHPDHYMGLVEFTHQIEAFARFKGIKVKITAPELFPFEEMQRFLFGEEGFNIKKLGGSRDLRNTLPERSLTTARLRSPPSRPSTSTTPTRFSSRLRVSAFSSRATFATIL